MPGLLDEVYQLAKKELKESGREELKEYLYPKNLIQLALDESGKIG